MDVAKRVHIAPLGIEHDRIVRPPVEYNADRVILLDYLPSALDQRPAIEDLAGEFNNHSIEYEVRECEMTDLFDALAAVGAAIVDHANHEVYVNLATGNKIAAIGGMIACMATNEARPYYVEAEQYGSHRGPVPKGVQSISSVPPYPIDRPEIQQLCVMQHIADSDRTTINGEPCCIKRELIEFGETADLQFMSEYSGETDKGKFRRLDAHIIKPLQERGFIEVEEVGTRRQVTLTQDGRNTLRAFRYLLERG